MTPKAIICDIDGTLAYMGQRKPYDFENVDQDEVKHATAESVRVFYNAGYWIILFSGREDSSKGKTAAWLKRNDIPYHELHMRKTRDLRKDALVKKELYETHVADKYNVLLVLDDRDQVVKMWREELNLPCFQVDYGNF